MSQPASMDYLRQPRRFGRAIWVCLAVLLIGGALVGMNVALDRFELSTPQVDHRSVIIDTVRRGPMTHEVRGIGNLEAEEVMWIPAVTDARIADIPALPGVAVKADTVLLVLQNPDLQLALQEAESTLASTEAELRSKRAELQNQLLTLEAALVKLRTEHELANETYKVAQSLFEKEVTTPHELRLRQFEAEGLKTRLGVETRRFEQFRDSLPDQIATFESAVDRAKAGLRLQQSKVDGLRVTAGIDGVLEQVPVEVGQQVTAGEKLARVVNPRKLKAVVKVPEVQSRYVQIGQAVRIDTHHAWLSGEVTRIDPGVLEGTVAVDVRLLEKLPEEARPDLSIIGIIEITRLENVLFSGRPVSGAADSTVGMFRLDGGGHAIRVPVDVGVASVSHMQIRNGLKEGDQIILSDMARYDSVDRVIVK